MQIPVSYTHLRYDYALRKYKNVYTGGSRSVGYVRNTDREKQYARSVVNQQIPNLLSKNEMCIRDRWYSYETGINDRFGDY